jgi:endonuclease YncB( thermonuclease family)
MDFKVTMLVLILASSSALIGCEPKSKTASSDDAQIVESQPSKKVRGESGERGESDEKADTSVPLEPRGVVQEAELRDLPGGVIDGDTFKAVGFAESLRLLSINSEELFHRKADRARADTDWKAYLAEETKDDGFETFGTPMGDVAKAYARTFFKGVDKVWLEYQSPIRTHGFFGRHLVYVWIKDSGEWVNYNLEAIRQGMSAYYTKYGRSERYHDAFIRAQREARDKKRGIWAPGAKSYPDYDTRMVWWNRRAEQIGLFKEHFDDRPDFIDLGTDTAFATLRNRLGRRVVVFGGPTSFAERGNPQRIRLNYRYRRDFPVVAFEPHDMTKSGVNPDKEEFIYVEGVVGMYRGDPQLRYDEKSWMSAGMDPPLEKIQ